MVLAVEQGDGYDRWIAKLGKISNLVEFFHQHN